MSRFEEIVQPSLVGIMVYNRKGGVGKTSVSGNLAALLAALGFNVVIIDGDDQQNVTKLDARQKWKASLSNVIMETQMGAIAHPPVPLLDAMVQIRKRLWLVPADSALGTASDHIGRMDEQEVLADRIADLRTQLPSPPAWESRFPWFKRPTVNISAFQLEGTTEEEYFQRPAFLDFALWDSPPAANHLTTAMMLASDKILVPVEMDQFSADGLSQVLDGIKRRFRHRSRKAEIIGVLPNKILHQLGDTQAMDFLESVWRNFPTLARRPIHYDQNIKNAWGYQQAALEYVRDGNGDSRGMRELCSLALELVGYEGNMAGVALCDICQAAVARSMETTKEA